ncbi:hypothetical protein ACLMJK_003549 [Lecanora helva]
MRKGGFGLPSDFNHDSVEEVKELAASARTMAAGLEDRVCRMRCGLRVSPVGDSSAVTESSEEEESEEEEVSPRVQTNRSTCVKESRERINGHSIKD